MTRFECIHCGKQFSSQGIKIHESRCSQRNDSDGVLGIVGYFIPDLIGPFVRSLIAIFQSFYGVILGLGQVVESIPRIINACLKFLLYYFVLLLLW